MSRRDAEAELERAAPDPNDRTPRCRVIGCGAVLNSTGPCQACAYRASKYAKVFQTVNPLCECGAPRVPKKANSIRLPKRCPLCTKLRAKAVAKGIKVP